jgi:hypothetical protein
MHLLVFMKIYIKMLGPATKIKHLILLSKTHIKVKVKHSRYRPKLA